MQLSLFFSGLEWYRHGSIGSCHPYASRHLHCVRFTSCENPNFFSAFYRSDSIVDLLNFTLAITIIGVPVGLPVCSPPIEYHTFANLFQAVVTTTMAVGAAYLAKKKAIVQKLSAIESLAGVEILCSDK